MDDDDPPSDGLEKGLRFGCGALLGGVVMFGVLIPFGSGAGHVFWFIVGLGALAFGWAATRYWDGFFGALGELLQAPLWWL